MNNIKPLFKGRVKYNTLILGLLPVIFIAVGVYSLCIDNSSAPDFDDTLYSLFAVPVWQFEMLGGVLLSFFAAKFPSLEAYLYDHVYAELIMIIALPFLFQLLVLGIVIRSCRYYVKGEYEKYRKKTKFLYGLWGYIFFEYLIAMFLIYDSPVWLKIFFFFVTIFIPLFGFVNNKILRQYEKE